MKRILIVEDNRSLLEGLAETLAQDGLALTLTESGERAREAFSLGEFAVVVSDLKLPDTTGIDLLKEFIVAQPNVVFIVITAFATVETAVEAMREGAFDFVTKPFAGDEITVKVQKALRQYDLRSQVKHLSEEAAQLRERIGYQLDDDGIVGSSPEMQEIKSNIDQLATSNAVALVLGETGTGKELIARAIHQRSPRAKGPFVAVNCAVFAESLLESELFGHEKGAFTGADRQKPGRFELASGGSIFLDEVGELPLSAQAKLLRVLQEREVERVGGTETIPVDVRLIAATNRVLETEIEAGRFRRDLYYRLNVVPIEIPPLRKRKTDIPQLAEHFLRRFEKENHKKIDGFSEAAMKRMAGYSWPGNVRELENVVERGVVLSRSELIDESLLPFSAEPTEAARPGNLIQRLEDYEKDMIREALDANNNNATKAADALGISRSTLRYKIEKYSL